VQQPGGQQFAPWAPVTDQQFQPGQAGFGQQVQAQQVPAYQAPQTQAAPVPGVAFPGQVAGASGGQAQPSPQQLMAQKLMAVARGLEQIIPGYQLLISVFQDAAVSPLGQSLPGVYPLLERLKEATYHHFATLGAIRRFLVGEASADVLASLATGVNYLTAIHSQTKLLLQQVLAAVPAEQRAPLNSLTQAVTAADGLLAQTVTAVQALVGPQIWEAARLRAGGAQPTVLAE
jgi:hypothetical protein